MPKLPDGFITFGDDTLDLFRQVAELLVGLTVAVVPIDAADSPSTDISEYDMHLEAVGTQGLHGVLLNDNGDPGHVAIERHWPDIRRIHIY